MTTRRGAAARAKTKALIETKARYDAAGTGRRIAAWNPGTRGPVRATEGLQRLRDRAQDSVRNDWASSSIVQRWATTLVGVGITPRWRDRAIRALWDKHVKRADADGVLDLYGMVTLGVRVWFADGEVFLRRRPRVLESRLPVPVQYQLIEGAYCPLQDSDVWPGMPVGNVMRQGIEFNKYGTRVAYWLWREHPHEPGARPTPDMLVRVAASEISHVFEPKRPGQIRGVSELAPMLVRIRSAGDFEDAVLDRQKLANLFVAFITRALPEMSPDDYDPDTGLPKWYGKNGAPLVGLEPGIQQDLQPGEDVKFANPPEAGTTYSDYLRSTHLGTAAGGGMPYELLSGDIKDVSDRTLRVVINEFRRFARQRQWQIVIPMLCQPMVDWFADAAVLSGALSISQLEEAKSPKWSPEGWDYIHPTQDAQGKQIELEMGVTSRDRIAGGRGDDIEEIDNERKADLDRSKKLGLEPPPPVAPAGPGGPGKPPGGEPKPKPAQPSALESAFMQFSQRLLDDRDAGRQENTSLIQAFTALAQVLATREPAKIENHTHVAPAAVENHTHVAPAAVENHTHVEVAPTPIENHNHVDVAPTAVTVNNDVQPTPIMIEAKAEIKEVAITSMPARETTTSVRRDAQDEIIETTTVEKDANP